MNDTLNALNVTAADAATITAAAAIGKGKCLSILGCTNDAVHRGLCDACLSRYDRYKWDKPNPSKNAPGADPVPGTMRADSLRRLTVYLDNRHLLRARRGIERLAELMDLRDARTVARYGRLARWLDTHPDLIGWVRAAADLDTTLAVYESHDYSGAVYVTNPATPELLHIHVWKTEGTRYAGQVRRNGHEVARFTGDRYLSKQRTRPWPLPDKVVSEHLFTLIMDNADTPATPHLVAVADLPDLAPELDTTPEPEPEPAAGRRDDVTPAEPVTVPYRDPVEEAAGMLSGVTTTARRWENLPDTPVDQDDVARAAVIAMIYQAAVDQRFPLTLVTAAAIREGRITIPPKLKARIRRIIREAEPSILGDYIRARRHATSGRAASA